MSGLLDAALKSTLLFAIALLADRLLFHRASAATRHVIMIAALVGALILPLLPRIMPSLRIPIGQEAIPAAADLLFRVDARGVAPSAPAATASAPHASPGIPAAWPRMMLFLWLAGVLAVLARRVAGGWIIRRIGRQSVPASGLLRAIASQMGIDVRVHAPKTMPMVIGLFRPTVLMPAEAAEWPEDQLRMVLLHEWAHIRRRDVIWQILGDLACALYWPHPLVWLVQRDALRRREGAADDMVLEAGVRASDYAQRLLEIARTLTAPPLCSLLAMARPQQLEGRLLRILASGVNRMPASRRLTASVAALVMTAAVTLAAMRPPLEDPSPMEAAAQAASQKFDFTAAVTAYHSALGATKEKFGDSSVEHARMLVKVAKALEAAHDKNAAHAAIDQAIRIFEVTAPFDPAYAEALYRSGIRYQLSKDLEKARAQYERGIEVARVAGDQNLWSLLSRNLNRMSSAEAIPVPPTPQPASSRPPTSPGTYRIGGGVSAPALLTKVEPTYTDEARAAGWQGVVVLSVEISATGTPENLRVLRPLGMGLDGEAVRAVRQWTFQPGAKDGQPVRVAATIEVNFRLL